MALIDCPHARQQLCALVFALSIVVAATTCPPGTYGSTCTQCATGTFSVAHDSQACQQCPAGWWSTRFGSSFDHGNMDSWQSCGAIITCGKWGKICGGYGITDEAKALCFRDPRLTPSVEKPNYIDPVNGDCPHGYLSKGRTPYSEGRNVIEKRFAVPVPGTYTLSLDFLKIDRWVQKVGWVQRERFPVAVEANGRLCWTKQVRSSMTHEQVCGANSVLDDDFKEKATCGVTINFNESILHVKVLAMPGEPWDKNVRQREAIFGIDNVAVQGPSGAVLRGPTACAQNKCAPGTYHASANGTAPTCTTCPAGYYQGLAQQPQCDQCPAGFVTYQTGATLRVHCCPMWVDADPSPTSHTFSLNILGRKQEYETKILHQVLDGHGCVLDGRGQQNIMYWVSEMTNEAYIAQASMTATNLTVRNGKAKAWPTQSIGDRGFRGGGIYFSGRVDWNTPQNVLQISHTEVSHCTFEQNQAARGGGGMTIYTHRHRKKVDGSRRRIVPSKVIIRSCSFAGNKAAIGDHYSNADVANLKHNFKHWPDPRATNSGAMLAVHISLAPLSSGGAFSGARGTFTNCVFLSNMAMKGGGAVAAVEGHFVGCTFTSNTAMQGGGAFEGKVGAFTNCAFISNQASAHGGAIAVSGLEKRSDTLMVKRCSFAQNVNAGSDGGGAVYAAPIVDFDRNVKCFFRIAWNIKNGRTKCDDPKKTLPPVLGRPEPCRCYGEKPSCCDPITGLSPDNQYSFGYNTGVNPAGYRCTSPEHPLARIESKADLLDRLNTKIPIIEHPRMLVSECSFTHNRATNAAGGAIRLNTKDPSSVGGLAGACKTNFTVTSCYFRQNTAGGSGGALAFAMSGLYTDGILYAKVRHFVPVRRCTFVQNRAGGLGGAIYADANVSVAAFEFAECYFAGNTASAGNSIVWNHAENTRDKGDSTVLRTRDGTSADSVEIELNSSLWRTAYSSSPHILATSFENVHFACEIGDAQPTWSYPSDIQRARGVFLIVHCRRCPANTSGLFDAVAGMFICKSCEAGKYKAQSPGSGSNATVLECVTCEPGYVCNDAAGRDPCARGRYQTMRSATGDCDACEPGLYASSPASTSCEKCETGFYRDSTGASTCTSCPVGYYQAFAGSVSCDMCTNGRYVETRSATACLECDSCALGYSANLSEPCTASRGGVMPPEPPKNETKEEVPAYCKVCEPGTYGDSVNQGACSICPAGYMSSTFGAQTCDACDKGSYTPTTMPIRDRCLTCPAGKSAGLKGMGFCTTCVAGTFGTKGATECSRCPVGYAQPLSERSTCTICGAGSVATDPGGKSSCTACKTEFEYVPVAQGGSICKSCADNAVAVSREGRLQGQTCECKPEYYETMLGLNVTWSPLLVPGATWAPNATDSSRACLKCPVGATCNENLDQDFTVQFEGRLATRPGYWRGRDWRTMRAAEGLSDDGEKFLPCPIPDACVGTAYVLKQLRSTNGSSSSRLPINVTSNASNVASQCRTGHTGVMCQECISAWRPDAASLCVSCVDDNGSPSGPGPVVVKSLSFTLLSLLLVAILTAYLTSQERRSEVEQASDSQDLADDATETSNAINDVVTRLGTVVPSLQRIVALNDVFAEVPWPPIMTQVLRVLKIFVMQVGKVLAFLSPCDLHVNIKEEVLIALLVVPWAVAVAFAAKLCAGKVLTYRLWKKNRGRRRAERKLQRRRRKKGKRHGGGGITDATPEGKTDAIPESHTHSLRQEEYVATARLIAFGMLAAKLSHPGISAQLLVFGVCQKDLNVMQAAVDVRCDWSDPVWPHVVAISMVGLVLFMLGMPLVLAVAVHQDKTRFRRQRELHAEDSAKERQHEVMSLLHVKTLQEKLAEKVHRWKERRAVRLEAQRHKSINWIVAKYRGSLWWWFLVEMLLSLVLISILQLASGELWHKYYAGILVASLQVFLPAMARPHRESADDWASIVGGAVYFLLVVARLSRFLVDLRIGSPDFNEAEHSAAVHETDVLIDTTFVIGGLAMFAVVFWGIIWEPVREQCLRPCCRSKKAVKVVPVNASHRSGIEEKDKTIEKASAAGAPTPGSSTGPTSLVRKRGSTTNKPPRMTRLQRCADDVLASVSEPLRREYNKTWSRLETLQAEIMATAIQAAARGRQSRRGGLQKGDFVHVLAELGRASGAPKTKSNGDAPKAKVVSIRRQRSAHRKLLHTKSKTAVLLNAATAYVDGVGEAKTTTDGDTGSIIAQDDDAKAAALLAAVEGWSQAEIQGLNENKRLSDKQVVAILKVRHEKEHADYQAALKSEAEAQKVKGRSKTVRRGLVHHFKKSALADKDLAAVFAAVDKDGSGTIDVGELIELYKNEFGRQLTLANAQELMRAADLDGDTSTMTSEELRRLLFGSKKARAKRSLVKATTVTRLGVTIRGGGGEGEEGK